MTALSVLLLVTVAVGVQVKDPVRMGLDEEGHQMPKKETLEHSLKVQEGPRFEKGGKKSATVSELEHWAAPGKNGIPEPAAPAPVQSQEVMDDKMRKAKGKAQARKEAHKEQEAKKEAHKHPMLDCEGTMLPLGAMDMHQRVNEMIANPSPLQAPELMSSELCLRLRSHNKDGLHSQLWEVLDPLLSKESNFNNQKINVVDIGSRMGAVGMKLAAYKSVKEVYEFHPGDEVCDYLKATVTLNVLHGKQSKGMGKIKVFQRRLHGKYVPHDPVPIYTIDNMIKNHELEHVGLIHIANNHVKALAGAVDLMKEKQPIVVTEASIPGTDRLALGRFTPKSDWTQDTLKFMKEQGYRSYSVDERMDKCHHNAQDNTFTGACRSFVHLPQRLSAQFSFFDNLVKSRSLEAEEEVRAELMK